MNLTRIATFKPHVSPTASLMVIDGHDIRVLHVDLPPQASEQAHEALILAAAQVQGIDLSPLDFFVHKNRDDTWALAFGDKPDVWPEDEPEEPTIG